MRIGILGIWRISSFYFWATDNVIFGIGLIWTLGDHFPRTPSGNILELSGFAETFGTCPLHVHLCVYVFIK